MVVITIPIIIINSNNNIHSNHTTAATTIITTNGNRPISRHVPVQKMTTRGQGKAII